MKDHKLAFPTHGFVNEHGNDVYGDDGLSRRELFAAMAMQGIQSFWLALSKHGMEDPDPGTVAKMAIDRADALIAALDKDQ